MLQGVLLRQTFVVIHLLFQVTKILTVITLHLLFNVFSLNKGCREYWSLFHFPSTRSSPRWTKHTEFGLPSIPASGFLPLQLKARRRCSSRETMELLGLRRCKVTRTCLSALPFFLPSALNSSRSIYWVQGQDSGRVGKALTLRSLLRPSPGRTVRGVPLVASLASP